MLHAFVVRYIFWSLFFLSVLFISKMLCFSTMVPPLEMNKHLAAVICDYYHLSTPKLKQKLLYN